MQYDSLAEIYHERMLKNAEDSLAHQTWMLNMEKVMLKNRFRPKSLLDLCCGTGLSTFPWVGKGLEVYGVDISKPMIDQAMRIAKRDNLAVLFLQQDATKLNMHRKFDAVTSVFDALNHILKKSELQECFKGVHEILNKGGIFMFDMNTEAKQAWLHGRTRMEEFDNFSVISTPTYNKEKKLANFKEVYFIKRGKFYERREENIKETNHRPEEIKRMLRKAKFKRISFYDADTLKKANRKTYRILYVAWK